MVKTELDSGDILFMKYDCGLTFSTQEYFKCYKNQFLNDKNYDEIGWAQRDDEEIYIWKTEENSNTKIYRYKDN